MSNPAARPEGGRVLPAAEEDIEQEEGEQQQEQSGPELLVKEGAGGVQRGQLARFEQRAC